MSDLLSNYTSITRDQLSNYDYLVVIDFEATCDNGDSPSISLSRNNQEMIEFPFVLLQILRSEQGHSRVLHSEQNYVLPEYSTQLTPFCENLTGINWNTLQQHGKPLRKVIQQFDNFIQENLKDKRFCIITDGEWDLKSLLMRESKNKNIPLLSHYYSFFDLRKEYKKCFPNVHVRGLASMVEHSGVNFIGRHHSGIDDCMTIVQLINYLLLNGHEFETPITIDPYYDPFRDTSFSDFRQSLNQPFTCNNINNTSYNNHHHHHTTHLIPMYAYPREMFYPYQSYQTYYQLYNKYVGNTYPSVQSSPSSSSSRRKRKNKRRANHSAPIPKAGLSVPPIAGENESDRSL